MWEFHQWTVGNSKYHGLSIYGHIENREHDKHQRISRNFVRHTLATSLIVLRKWGTSRRNIEGNIWVVASPCRYLFEWAVDIWPAFPLDLLLGVFRIDSHTPCLLAVFDLQTWGDIGIWANNNVNCSTGSFSAPRLVKGGFSWMNFCPWICTSVVHIPLETCYMTN